MDSFDYLLDNCAIIMQKQSEDVFVIYCFGKPYTKLINCKGVSFAFIKEIFQMKREFFLESFEKEDEEVIDMQAKLKEWIRDGAWDWDREKEKEEEIKVGSLITGFEDVIKVKD